MVGRYNLSVLRRGPLAGLLAIGLIAGAGCGKKDSQSADEDDDQFIVQTIKAPDADTVKLPPDQKSPPVDKGRVVMPIPNGWKGASRSKDYIFGLNWVSPDRAPIPFLQLVGEDTTESDTTAENLADQTKARHAELMKKYPGESYLEVARPRIVGTIPYIRYVVKGNIPGIYTSKQILETVVGGRRYGVELIYKEGKLKGHQPYSYAVAANLEFPKRDGEKKPEEKQPEDEKKPEEKKPDADKPVEITPVGDAAGEAPIK